MKTFAESASIFGMADEEIRESICGLWCDGANVRLCLRDESGARRNACVKFDPFMWSASGAECAYASAELLSRPAGFFIEELTRPMRERIRDDDPPGLGNADFRIGILERWLTLTFLLIGSPGAIGFLIAATSIFRFGSLTGSGEFRKTQCILFGTMSGVFLALLVWIALDAALSALPHG